MPAACHCPACDFRFVNQHVRDGASGQAPLVCTACLALFTLRTESFRGPRIGELVELHTLHRREVRHHKRKAPRVEWSFEPAGQHVLVEERDADGATYPLEELRCPSCQVTGRLVAGFQTGDTCPKCRTAGLVCDVVEP